MCGIVGFTGEHQAAPILLDGLSKLEYRGYDSAGIAIRDGSADAEIIKAKGRLKVLAEKTNDGESVKGTCGIGHTRWATHGEPSENNAHPHASDDGNVVAVHNGIIENYQELKDKLVRKGYTFYSETDTEVAVKLIDYYYKKYEGTPVDAINHALVRIRGSYALAIMFRDYPEEIYVARKDSPMILGVANGESYIGSDVPAILKYTRDVYYIGNQEMARVRKGEITFYNLDGEEIEKEMAAIAKTGLQEILILTGESKTKSNVEYIGKACEVARKYFKVVGLEVYPMNSDEYAYLHKCGADYVTVFQETYNSDKYETLHLAGHKRIFPYRLNTQERALKGGMRGVGFAALLGLDDFRKDAFATGYHAYLLQRKYPHAEIAFSCPRLCPIINNNRINPMDVHEPQLLQVVCAYRLFMPFASITVSTRECARVRDNLVNIAATKISAGVSTGIGSHVEDIEDKGDDQFEISDGRTVDEVFDALKKNGLQPVMNDYIYL